MVSAFTIYDLTFLALFVLVTAVFLYTHKKNLQRQGILYLYRTRIGLKWIESFTKKYKKLLFYSQYLVIFSGFILMISMIYLLIKFAWLYLTSPIAAQVLKVPVIIPLIPYLPDIFKIDFLPSFNFTYWILIIAIIAIPHEFAHGIFARFYKIKVHSTGFGFLGPFLAFFVEPNEKQLAKKSKISQMAVLASGTFANVLVSIITAIILALFFLGTFTPAGVNFNAYASSVVNVSQIDEVNGINITDIKNIPHILNNSIAEIKANGNKYYVNPSSLNLSLNENIELIQVIDDSPAFNARIEGAISQINGEKITSLDNLIQTLQKYNPGDIVEINTLYQESVRVNKVEERSYIVELDEREGRTFLGIGVIPVKPSGILGKIYYLISTIKDPIIFYKSSLGAFGWFIYYFLWWTLVICISVALVNMLPVGIFDGGRFFYLTIWGVTKNEDIGKKAFAFSTWFILLLVIAMMIKWLLIF